MRGEQTSIKTIMYHQEIFYKYIRPRGWFSPESRAGFSVNKCFLATFWGNLTASLHPFSYAKEKQCQVCSRHLVFPMMHSFLCIFNMCRCVEIKSLCLKRDRFWELFLALVFNSYTKWLCFSSRYWYFQLEFYKMTWCVTVVRTTVYSFSISAPKLPKMSLIWKQFLSI